MRLTVPNDTRFEAGVGFQMATFEQRWMAWKRYCALVHFVPEALAAPTSDAYWAAAPSDQGSLKHPMRLTWQDRFFIHRFLDLMVPISPPLVSKTLFHHGQFYHLYHTFETIYQTEAELVSMIREKNHGGLFRRLLIRFRPLRVAISNPTKKYL